jgi:ketosteroid isomerase-like protein
MQESRNVAAQYWEALASMDADAVAERFTPHARFRFGNGRTLHGRAAIRRLFVELFARMAWIDRRNVVEWSQSTCVVDEVDLSFVFDDGRRLTIPVTTVFRASGPQIEECRMSFYPEPALESACCFLRNYYGVDAPNAA